MTASSPRATPHDADVVLDADAIMEADAGQSRFGVDETAFLAPALLDGDVLPFEAPTSPLARRDAPSPVPPTTEADLTLEQYASYRSS